MKLAHHVLASHKHVLALGSLALAAVSLTTGASSLALFTDSQSNTGSAFTTGTIDISVTPTTAFFSVPNMMPGDDFTRSVTVNNLGSSELRWSVDSTATTGTGGLMDQIDMQIGVMNATACATWDGTGAAATGSLVTINLQDQVLASGANVVTCFRASLPLSTGNAFQDQTAGTTFAFSAEQTDNNPA